YGFVRFQFPHERLIVSAGLIAAMAIAACFTPYKHRFPALEPLYADPISIPAAQSAATNLIANDAALDAWLRIAGAKPKLAIVATSGGRTRAAGRTTSVLHAPTTGR